MYPLSPARISSGLVAGTWQPQAVAVRGQRPSATIACPRCGQPHELEVKRHPINKHGQVVNLWRCASPGCGFVSQLALHEWAATSVEIS